MEFQEAALASVLADMDVPEFRRDTTKPENVRWLLRNLAIRNRGHEGFSLAITVLRKKARQDA